MLTENKFSKYLIYAIGEIVLVVIGILIALQINNWNEIQKQLKLEKEILAEVKVGLESDYEIINQVIEDHLEFINSKDKIIDWIENNNAYNDTLIPYFKHITWITYFLPKDAQFESLKEFGIRNISNKELGYQITNLYDVIYEEVLLWQDECKKKTMNFGNSAEEYGFEFVKDSAQISLDIQPINPAALQLNKSFLFKLKVINATLKIYTEIKLKLAQTEIEKTLKLIEKELNQK